MKTMTSADFRRDYATLTKPVIVTANRRTLGVWTPGLALALGEVETYQEVRTQRETALEDEVRQLKRELASRSTFSPGIEDRAFERGQQSVAMKTGRDRQKLIDATLAKVNRKVKA